MVIKISRKEVLPWFGAAPQLDSARNPGNLSEKGLLWTSGRSSMCPTARICCTQTFQRSSLISATASEALFKSALQWRALILATREMPCVKIGSYLRRLTPDATRSEFTIQK
jgi:hypothetical protein